jgi:hypothetical protein
LTELEKIRLRQAERFQEQKQAQARAAQEAAKAPPTSKKKSKSKKTPQKKTAASGKKPAASCAKSTDNLNSIQDDDAFLDALMDANKQCAFADCGKSVQTLGHTCEFCKYRFCYGHIQPELHGCAQDAGQKAQKDFKSKVSQPQDVRKLKSHQRAHLKRELGKKIEHEKSKRTSAKKKTSPA